MSRFCCRKSERYLTELLSCSFLLFLLVIFSRSSVALAEGGGETQVSKAVNDLAGREAKAEAKGEDRTAGARNAEEKISAFLDEYEKADEQRKLEALDGLFSHINVAGCKINMGLRNRLSATLIPDFKAIEGDDDSARSKRVLIVYILAGCGKNKEAQEFVLGIIDNGPDYLRQCALGWATRSLKDDYDLYAKYEELERKNLITTRRKLILSNRIDKERTRRELWKIIRETKDKEMFVFAGSMMTSYEGKGQSPKELSLIFRRIQELGLDNTGIWFWLDAEKCAKYLEGVKGKELVRAVEILDKAGLIAQVFPVVMKRGLIAHPDVHIREIILRKIPSAVSLKMIDVEVARKIVEERLAVERGEGIRRRLRITLSLIEPHSSTVME